MNNSLYNKDKLLFDTTQSCLTLVNLTFHMQTKLDRNFNEPLLKFQRGIRHSDTTECGHQETFPAISKCDAREARLPRVQAHEARQPQECKYSRLHRYMGPSILY